MIRYCLGLVLYIFSSYLYADELRCVLPSLKDGKIIERININLTGGHLFVKVQRRSHNEIEDRKVLFHSFNNPIETIKEKEIKWENQTSVILLESKYKETVFAPDIVIVDWDKAKLKNASSYENSFVNTWECKKYENPKVIF